jgi:hypothetical protein
MERLLTLLAAARRCRAGIGLCRAVAGLGVMLVMASCTTSGTPASGPSPEAASRAATESTALADKWGVDRVSVRVSGHGYLVDFRYRVVNRSKAQPLFEPKSTPYLVESTTGAKLQVASSPKTGPLRTTQPPEDGKTYFVIFGNSGQWVRAGARVTVTIGEFSVANVVVE